MLRNSNLLHAVRATLLIGMLLSAAGAFGQDGGNDAKLRAGDRAVVAACLKIAADATKGGAGASSDECSHRREDRRQSLDGREGCPPG